MSSLLVLPLETAPGTEPSTDGREILGPESMVMGSVLLYAGFTVGLAGALSLVRPLGFLGIPTRERAAIFVGLGLLLIVAAALLPAPLRRAAAMRTQLDRFIPAWQFAERHEILVRAPPQRVEQAVRAVPAREIRLFLLLTWIRRPRLPSSDVPADILAPPADRPILDVALGSTFLLLAEEPAREIVIGTLVMVPPELRRLPPAERRRWRAALSPADFKDLADPGYAKAAMNFRMVDQRDGTTRLVTETRVFATDPATRRRFALYWRAIYPGSSLIRYGWLAAIRDRALRNVEAG